MADFFTHINKIIVGRVPEDSKIILANGALLDDVQRFTVTQVYGQTPKLTIELVLQPDVDIIRI